MAARDVSGREKVCHRGGLRFLRPGLPRQVRQGGGMSGQGSRLIAGLPRRPGRTLEARSIDQPDREQLRYRPAQNDQNQGLPIAQRRAGDGIQAVVERSPKMAQAQRVKSSPGGHSRSDVQGLYLANPKRRLIDPSPTFDGPVKRASGGLPGRSHGGRGSVDSAHWFGRR